MRQKFDEPLYFDRSVASSAKIVRQYEQKHTGVSQILDANPEILGLIHKDLKPLSRGSRRGR